MRPALALAALLVALGSPSAAGAAPGDLDTSFGDGGTVTTDVGGTDQATGVAVQSDGKIIAAGHSNTIGPRISIARYNPNGTLDPSFASDGLASVPSFSARGSAVVIQPDGKIVVAGSTTGSDEDFALVRLNPNGSVDSTFSGDGRLTTDFGSTEDNADGVAIAADGKIIVVGTTDPLGPTPRNIALARYGPGGSLDPSFSGDGKVATDFFAGDDFGDAVAVQPDGRIVVNGSTTAGSSEGRDFAVARYNLDGDLDGSFSFDGKTIVDFGSPGIDGDEFAREVAIQHDGKIVASGRSRLTDSNGGISDVSAIARLDADGFLDVTFGDFGTATADCCGGEGLAIAPNGKLVFGGGNNLVLTRHTPSGSPDTSFSDDGWVSTHIAFLDVIHDIAIAPDGGIVGAGYVADGHSSPQDFALVRYEGDPAPPPDTTIDSGPAAGATIAARQATFGFSSPSQGVVGFECNVDGSGFSPCSSPHTMGALADGPHTFAVRAVNVIGSRDPTPTARSFTVDTSPPVDEDPPPGGEDPPSGEDPPPGEDPLTDRPANEVLFACDDRRIAILFLKKKGKGKKQKAVIKGLAHPDLLGAKVKILAKVGKRRRRVAKTPIAGDGSFKARARLPGTKAQRKLRYIAKVARERSRPVKLNRRALLKNLRSAAGLTTIKGKVRAPRAKKRARVIVQRRVACKGERKWLKVAKGKQNRRGAFRLRFENPEGFVASTFRAKTFYAKRKGKRAKRKALSPAAAVTFE